MKLGKILSTLFFWIVGIVTIAPFVVIAGVSVNERKSLTFPPEGFNLGWYADLFLDAEWRAPLMTSLSIAICASLLAVLIAFPVAWFNWRYRTGFGKLVAGLGAMPFLLPPVITAMGFLTFFIILGYYGEFWTVVVAHAIFLVTLPLVSLSLGFEDIDTSLVEASRSMGASEATVLRTVVLPMIRPYVISGFCFVFVISLNEYIIAVMTVGAVFETLPMKIFNALRYGYTPVMAAASVVFVASTVLIFSLVAAFSDLPKLLGARSK
ncbi:ABC transporter permease [Yangia mangrovi]|uniref:ABC transporter permease n=1 Tax=Alloyangia mangrovi TaxID=1779329 RepID=A0A2A3K0M6_9RHOB|nr:ABC transporter permease [Alloyangia mangrovi]MCT4371363.1 ABC transporter permease [Alloyangia mangrovi]